MLTDKQREVMDYYYNDDLSLAEIAEHTNITRQGVRDSIKRGEALLLELEAKLRFGERMLHAEHAAESLHEILAKMEELNALYLFSTPLRDLLREMETALAELESDQD
ncbi:sigma factor-like helix-turn-helix DNA-binding protein [Feifania hominis]